MREFKFFVGRDEWKLETILPEDFERVQQYLNNPEIKLISYHSVNDVIELGRIRWISEGQRTTFDERGLECIPGITNVVSMTVFMDCVYDHNSMVVTRIRCNGNDLTFNQQSIITPFPIGTLTISYKVYEGV